MTVPPETIQDALERIGISGDPEEAYQQGLADGAAAERDRIRQLAEHYGAIYPAHRKRDPADTTELVVATSFADLLDGAP